MRFPGWSPSGGISFMSYIHIINKQTACRWSVSLQWQAVAIIDKNETEAFPLPFLLYPIFVSILLNNSADTPWSLQTPSTSVHSASPLSWRPEVSPVSSPPYRWCFPRSAGISPDEPFPGIHPFLPAAGSLPMPDIRTHHELSLIHIWRCRR